MENNLLMFKHKLGKAVDKAIAKPKPTKAEIKNFKMYLSFGLTEGQYRIVVQVYNSTLERIVYLAKQNKN